MTDSKTGANHKFTLSEIIGAKLDIACSLWENVRVLHKNTRDTGSDSFERGVKKLSTEFKNFKKEYPYVFNRIVYSYAFNIRAFHRYMRHKAVFVSKNENAFKDIYLFSAYYDAYLIFFSEKCINKSRPERKEMAMEAYSVARKYIEEDYNMVKRRVEKKLKNDKLRDQERREIIKKFG